MGKLSEYANVTTLTGAEEIILSQTSSKNATIRQAQAFQFLGKKLAAIGDSITYGTIPRNYAGYPGQLNSYAKLTADALGMTFLNYGLSGSTVGALAVSDPTNDPFVYRYAAMDNSADVILVMGGANDIRKDILVGTINDTDETTFYGALHILCAGLYQKYFIDQNTTVGKAKKIILCTPIKMGVNNDSGALYALQPYVDAIKAIGNYYSFPVLDFYQLSGINPHLNRTIEGTVEGYTGHYNPYITDGTHPTNEGHQLISNVLTGFLKSLI